MDRPVWCVHCHRVWEGGDLGGQWPRLVCPHAACNGGEPGTFMPYHQTRRLMAPHWPPTPASGQVLPLRARPATPPEPTEPTEPTKHTKHTKHTEPPSA